MSERELGDGIEVRLRDALAKIEAAERELRCAIDERERMASFDHELDAARARVAELEALVAEKVVEVASLQHRCEELESRPTSLADGSLEEELREREALVEELEVAIQAQRASIEQRDRRLAEHAAELANLRKSKGDPST